MIARRPSPEAEPFWAGLQQGVVWLPRCKECGRFHFYPRQRCPHCWSVRLEWVTASGRGTLHTFSVLHKPVLNIEPPVVVAVVDLEEGVRLVTNLIDAGEEVLACDLPVEAAITPGRDGLPLLCFRIRRNPEPPAR